MLSMLREAGRIDSNSFAKELIENLKIKSAKSILIIGGGPSGVEFAGELASDCPEKKITLVHNGPRLLEFIGRKAGSKLQSKNVKVLLDQSVDLEAPPEEKGEYKTSAGETIAADLHYLCVDRPLGSSWMQESFLREWISSSGRMMVDDHLRVLGQKNVFAIGDITDVPELKQGLPEQRHAAVVAKNLKVMVKGGKECRICKYKPLPVVALGRENAVAQLPFFKIVGILPGMIKSRDLFVQKTRRMMGLDRRSRSAVASAAEDRSEVGSASISSSDGNAACS